MNKIFIALTSVALFVFACSQTQDPNSSEKEEKPAGEEAQKKQPRKLEMVKTSELAALMRLMEAEMKSAKVSIESGFSYHDSLSFSYANLYTAAPTEEHMKSDQFDDFASSYLKLVEIFQKSAPEKRKENYNLLVNSCLNCHAVHCPGPVAKINELRIP